MRKRGKRQGCANETRNSGTHVEYCRIMSLVWCVPYMSRLLGVSNAYEHPMDRSATWLAAVTSAWRSPWTISPPCAAQNTCGTMEAMY